jgi:cytidylate kinase
VYGSPDHDHGVGVSRTHRSGGSVIAPALAQRLKLPFVDRLVPLTDLSSLTALSEQLTPEERAQSPMSRLLGHIVRASTVLGAPSSALQDVQSIDDARRELRDSLRRAIADGAVVLGRGGALVLQAKPGVFHVRLDGPADRRVARAMVLEGVDEATAAARLQDTDRTRAQVVKRLFDRDSADPSLYHLVLDATAFSIEDVVELLADAANLFWRAGTSASPC